MEHETLDLTPSSPVSSTVDSSPVSSPSSELEYPRLSFVHPLAASAKATRSPPEYEKRHISSSPVRRNKTCFKSSRTCQWPNPDSHPRTFLSSSDDSFATVPGMLEDKEAKIWDDAITKVFDCREKAVELESVPTLFLYIFFT